MSENLADWQPRPRPERKVLDGRTVRLEPLSAEKHGDGLFEASAVADGDTRFRWLFDTVPETRADLQ
ncbi:GNAT family N-acetyltransferase, partial [Mesorhizobium sp. M7A.T.Ca.TU.009.01.3.2]